MEYDVETGFYYVSSRYYDPEIGRFLNADTTDILTLSIKALSNKNLFSYCDNNPIVRVDVTGYAWETIFDVVSLGASIVEVAANPADPWAWAGLVGDAVDLIPFVTGIGEVTRTIKIVNKVDNAADAAKATKKIDTGISVVKKTHGNSLKSNKVNYGYALVDSNNNIMKFGETINPTRRYTKKYLTTNGYTMRVLDFGSKQYIHNWQFDMNMYYLSKYQLLPPLNKKGW